jgi:hypothetical protein
MMFNSNSLVTDQKHQASGLPRAGRMAVPYLLIAAVSAIAGVNGFVLPSRAGVLSVTALLCAVVTYAVGYLRRMLARYRADQWIAHSVGARPCERVIAERSAELVGCSSRQTLSRAFTRMVSDSERPPLFSSRVPVNRVAVTAHRAGIDRLAAVLGDTSRAVSARGVALADELITSPGSPAYGPGEIKTRLLREAVTQALVELERGA